MKVNFQDLPVAMFQKGEEKDAGEVRFLGK